MGNEASTGASGPTSNIGGPDERVRLTRGGWVATGINSERRRKRQIRGVVSGDDKEKQIIEAAKTAFAEHGYYGARIEDILKIAGISRGGFYAFFENKREAFYRVHETVMAEMAEAIRLPSDLAHPHLKPFADLELSNSRFLRFYRDNSQVLQSLEQVAVADPAAAALSERNRRRHIERVRNLVERWQNQGIASQTVNSEAAAVALVTMLSGAAHFLIRGELDHDADWLARELSEFWARSIELVDPDA